MPSIYYNSENRSKEFTRILFEYQVPKGNGYFMPGYTIYHFSFRNDGVVCSTHTSFFDGRKGSSDKFLLNLTRGELEKKLGSLQKGKSRERDFRRRFIEPKKV
jgi:hypothetical protein